MLYDSDQRRAPFPQMVNAVIINKPRGATRCALSISIREFSQKRYGPTDRPTDRPNDKVAYRVAYTRLKMIPHLKLREKKTDSYC